MIFTMAVVGLICNNATLALLARSGAIEPPAASSRYNLYQERKMPIAPNQSRHLVVGKRMWRYSRDIGPGRCQSGCPTRQQAIESQEKCDGILPPSQNEFLLPTVTPA